MKIERPVCVLMAALGGQGGGVLADWLVSAARIDRLQAQATSIPGVAQRTGATTYYFEVYPQPDLTGRPVFSIFPASGAIDLMVSFEPMEAARALSGGFISQDTTVITARERIYATFEKIKPGNGITPLEPMFDALGKMAGTVSIVEMTKAARSAKCHPNAVMFGAMVASGILPIQLASCRKAISQSGVAVESNLAGFESGMQLIAEPAVKITEATAVFDKAPEAFASAVQGLPQAVQPMAGHAAAHLLDYQNAAYVELFFTRLNKVVARDGETNNYRLSVAVARRLAAWMAFEDIIRVAQLKTRAGRLKRIRDELGIGKYTPLYVHDYLKPGRQELRGIMPKALGQWITEKQKAETDSDEKPSGMALKINTAGPVGWALMRLLAALKSWRPHSIRYEHEQKMVTRWLAVIGQTAPKNYDLACNLADLAVWARGYGDTRHRGFAQLTQLLTKGEQQIKTDKAAYGEAVLASLEKARSVPD